MDKTNYEKLTARQRALCDQVRAEAVDSGRPVADLLLLAEVSRRDRAAVADVFVPGAGAEYLS